MTDKTDKCENKYHDMYGGRFQSGKSRLQLVNALPWPSLKLNAILEVKISGLSLCATNKLMYKREKTRNIHADIGHTVIIT